MLPKIVLRHVMRSPFLLKAIAFIKIFIIGKGFEPVRDFRRDQANRLVSKLVKAYFTRESLQHEARENAESLESDLALSDRRIVELEIAWERFKLETITVTKEEAIAISQHQYSTERVGV